MKNDIIGPFRHLSWHQNTCNTFYNMIWLSLRRIYTCLLCFCNVKLKPCCNKGQKLYAVCEMRALTWPYLKVLLSSSRISEFLLSLISASYHKSCKQWAPIKISNVGLLQRLQPLSSWQNKINWMALPPQIQLTSVPQGRKLSMAHLIYTAKVTHFQIIDNFRSI